MIVKINLGGNKLTNNFCTMRIWRTLKTYLVKYQFPDDAVNVCPKVGWVYVTFVAIVFFVVLWWGGWFLAGIWNLEPIHLWTSCESFSLSLSLLFYGRIITCILPKCKNMFVCISEYNRLNWKYIFWNLKSRHNPSMYILWIIPSRSFFYD